jgi:hypothetical protein
MGHLCDDGISSVQSPSLLAELIEAGDRLSPFLQHDGGCAWRMKQNGKSCECGLDAKWAAWETAKRTANNDLSGRR